MAESSYERIATGYADFVYPAPADLEAVRFVGGKAEVTAALCEGYPYRVTMARGDAFDKEDFAAKCRDKLQKVEPASVRKLPELIRFALRVLTDDKVVPGKFLGGAVGEAGAAEGGATDGAVQIPAEAGGGAATGEQEEFRDNAASRQKTEQERKARLHARSQQWLAELADVARFAKAGHRVFGAARRWTATQKGQKRGDPAGELTIAVGGWCQSRTAEAATRLAPLVHTKKAEALFNAAVGGSQQNAHFPPMRHVFDELFRVARSLPRYVITRAAVREQVRKINGELRAPSGMRAKVLKAFLDDATLLDILHKAVQGEVDRLTVECWRGSTLHTFIARCYKRFSGRYLRKSAKSFAVESLRLVVSAEPFYRIVVQLLIEGGIRLFREQKQNGLATIGAMAGISLDVTRFFWDQTFEPILREIEQDGGQLAPGAALQAQQRGAAETRKVGLVLIIDSANQFNTERFVRLLQCGRQVGMHPSALLFLLAANWKKEVAVANGSGLAWIPEHDDLVIGSPEALFVSLVMQAMYYEAVRWFFELVFEGSSSSDAEAPSVTKVMEAEKKARRWLAELAEALDCYSKKWKEYTREDVDESYKDSSRIPTCAEPAEFTKKDTDQWKELFATYDVKLCIDDAGIKLCVPRWTLHTGFTQDILKRGLGFVELCFKLNELFVAPDKFKLLVISLSSEPEKTKMASTLVAACSLLGIRPTVKFEAKLVGAVYSDAPLTATVGQVKKAIGYARWICGNTRKSLGFWLAGGDIVDVVQFAHVSAVLHHFAALLGRKGYSSEGESLVEQLEEQIARGMAIELGFDEEAMSACRRRTRANTVAEVVFSEMTGIEQPTHTASRVVSNMVCKWAAATGDCRAADQLFHLVEDNDENEDALAGVNSITLVPPAVQRRRYNWLRNHATTALSIEPEDRKTLPRTADLQSVVVVAGQKAGAHDPRTGKTVEGCVVVEVPPGFSPDEKLTKAAEVAAAVAAVLKDIRLQRCSSGVQTLSSETAEQWQFSG